jgi:oligopeptide/dipeptide ABC transporter ATP-binding protein
VRGPILEAVDVAKHFRVGQKLFDKGSLVRAVDGISLRVRRGETVAIVGESGCGKSTLARLLTRLLDPTSGNVLFEGEDVTGIAGERLASFRRDVQFVFQDPFSSLNPRLSVGRLVGEPLEVHRPYLSAPPRLEEVARLLAQVGLRPEHADRYPHEFSGGQRQRIGIARALASGPKLVVADEPVSALDVSVQAQVVNLLEDLKAQLGLTLVVMAHDLAVIRHMSDRVAVMYLGQVVETGRADSIFEAPRHPYTRALLDAIPEPSPVRRRDRVRLEGDIPSPAAPPSGCRFHTRCPDVRPDCAMLVPRLEDGEHRVACHYWREIAATDSPVRAGAAPFEPAAAKRIELYQAATAARQDNTERGTLR